MLKKTYRLKKNKEFKDIYRTAHSYGAKNIVLYVKNRQDEEKKIGFSVSKKIGKAHVRNKMKRRMRACIEQEIQNIENGKNLILIARKPIVDAPFSHIQRDIVYLLKKSGVYIERDTKEDTLGVHSVL